MSTTFFALHDASSNRGLCVAGEGSAVAWVCLYGVRRLDAALLGRGLTRWFLRICTAGILPARLSLSRERRSPEPISNRDKIAIFRLAPISLSDRRSTLPVRRNLGVGGSVPKGGRTRPSDCWGATARDSRAQCHRCHNRNTRRLKIAATDRKQTTAPCSIATPTRCFLPRAVSFKSPVCPH